MSINRNIETIRNFSDSAIFPDKNVKKYQITVSNLESIEEERGKVSPDNHNESQPTDIPDLLPPGTYSADHRQ